MLTEYQLNDKRLQKALRHKDSQKKLSFNSNASHTGKYRDKWNALPKISFAHAVLPSKQQGMWTKVKTFFRRNFK